MKFLIIFFILVGHKVTAREVAAGSLAAWWHASIGETGHSAY